MVSKLMGYRHLSCVLVMGLSITSCSDDTIKPSSETFSSAANVHSNEQLITQTAEIDEQLEENLGAILGGQRPLFDIETQLVERKVIPDTREINPLDGMQERNVYYGDLHVHTAYSFDGYAFGTLATPYDAYRFAKGEAIKNPAGFNMQLTRPMDFYAVTDHAVFLGLLKAAADKTSAFSKNEFSEPFHDLNAPENFGIDLISRVKRLFTFAGFIPNATKGINDGSLNRQEVLGVVRNAWEDTIDAAEQFNAPGSFTTFAAYEYTTSSADMGNLHRNVIFKGTERLPREPFSRAHSNNPEDLWSWMDELRSKGVESLAIPHNSNGSNGEMFKVTDWNDNPFDETYVKTRIRNEPLVEITQIKGTSETHPILSTRDEWAGFEIMPYRVATGALSKVNGSFARQALLNGLSIEKQGIGNPYQFGFIGSSDTHSAASQNDETLFVSKLGILSSFPEQRGSVPIKGIDGPLAYYGSKILAEVNPTPLGKSLYVKINGDIYAGGATPTFGASGLAAVWAEENTRDSIYSAFRRKEVFATSGPRLRIRFFAGYDFDQSMLTDADGVDQAYAKGVSMGGALVEKRDVVNVMESPGFLVMASADPENAPLQRLQIIKGWLDEDGTAHEDVIDVACAGDAEVNSKTNRCPDNGARVDITDCSINPATGAAQLSALWHDPDFRPNQRAFYYARALENPTCRWSTWDAIRAGIPTRPDLATTIQERVWSSPIHYLAK
ncbi:DUF3604 domain-containing protein [Gammaproteobacteria bacterium]|nr:DUF3604 domain-containing protein [Gammaproteobacteria bacterium]